MYIMLPCTSYLHITKIVLRKLKKKHVGKMKCTINVMGFQRQV